MDTEQKKLVTDNMNYARALSWVYAHRHRADYNDLVSAAYEGLCIAAIEYKPELGKFHYYARYWIAKMLKLEVQFLLGHDKQVDWRVSRKPPQIVVTVCDLLDEIESQGNFLESLQGHKYDILYDAIMELEPRERYVINAYYFYRMTEAEICKDLGKSSAQYWRFKALEKLRGILRGKYYEQVG